MVNLDRIKQFLKRVPNALIWRYKVYKPYLIRPKHMIYLFGSPGHSNMGDQAQTYCITKWLEHNYPSYGIRIFTLSESTESVFVLLRRFIRKNDKLICHSGYHITDLYNERLPYMELAKRFKDHQIIIFPQTVFFKDQKKLIENADTFNKHGNVLLMCRDEVSHNEAMKYFVNCRLMLMPDIVTSLIGTRRYDYKRDGILFCIRNDKESFYSKSDIEELRKRFPTERTNITDTTISKDSMYISKHREEILEQIFNEYAQYKVVVTDRYHGTIFSLIAGTPVVVIGSSDHKLSSGVRWFPDSFSDYVYFANTLEEAYTISSEILKSTSRNYHLPPYFKKNYYDGLKYRIEEEFSSSL